MSNRRRKGRVLNGLLLLDKPAGITSNLALQKVKKLLNATKAGHTGSLDPLATGMLIICFGQATKISNYLLTADKHYDVTLMLGVTTDTGDADGRVLKRQDASSIAADDINKNIKFFTGYIEQVPPMFSAIKYHGIRLHKLARQGIEVERQSRKVQIYNFELIHREKNLLYMHVHCSKGTYIRALVEDLGRRLACGAHIVELRRTSIGPFVNSQLVTLSEIESFVQQDPCVSDKVLIPVDVALQALPALSVGQELMRKMCNGHPVWIAKSPTSGQVRIYDTDDQFFGVGTVLDDGRIAPKCLR